MSACSSYQRRIYVVEDTFKIISNLPSGDALRILEGCNPYFDGKKKKWIGSGKTSGDGEKACFGRSWK